ncbi:hypothetical protein [Nocardioides cavernaquae]|uniref:hypothetical protein n=1 Tax=Nocardioides cavernaquae TaxID=2321396 RepID=UPI001603B412|nr:hypothetical protein [Nocardioides cavernaquae]
MRTLTPLEDLLDLQDGVVARRQVIDLHGESDATIRRRLRRREWVIIQPGVYLNHTGTPTWRQRAWAATLYAAPSALAGTSALRAADGPGRRDYSDDGPIRVIVAADRDVRSQPGVEVERRESYASIVHQQLSPPRVRIEHAAIDAAAAAPTDMASIGVLSDAIRSRRTTAQGMLKAAESRKRLRRRHLIIGVLADTAAGAASVLEIEYLRRVERAHGLPSAQRQIRDVTARTGQSRAVVNRDAELPELGLIIELDGRIGHSTSAERDAGLERDLDAALTDRSTLRLGWGQAYVRPCSTAAKLAVLLRKLGWQGQMQSCPSCPAVADQLAVQVPTNQGEDFSSVCDEKSSA